MSGPPASNASARITALRANTIAALAMALATAVAILCCAPVIFTTGARAGLIEDPHTPR
jgi:hypothetical protein